MLINRLLIKKLYICTCKALIVKYIIKKKNSKNKHGNSLLRAVLLFFFFFFFSFLMSWPRTLASSYPGRNRSLWNLQYPFVKKYNWLSFFFWNINSMYSCKVNKHFQSLSVTSSKTMQIANEIILEGTFLEKILLSDSFFFSKLLLLECYGCQKSVSICGHSYVKWGLFWSLGSPI